MIEISEDVLWAKIGRLTVENELLRKRLAELENPPPPEEPK